MATIQDHDFVKICAELASCLSISLSSARRKVELAASQANAKGLDAQKSIAQGLLEAARSRPQKGEGSFEIEASRERIGLTRSAKNPSPIGTT